MYIDPAATSFVVQAIAGIVISCGVVVGIFWKRIKAFFEKKKIERMEKTLKAEAEKKAAK